MNEKQRVVVVDLHNCTASTKWMDDQLEEEYTIPVKTDSQQTSFFPLILDDYFMSVAILTRQFCSVVDHDEVSIKNLSHRTIVLCI